MSTPLPQALLDAVRQRFLVSSPTTLEAILTAWERMYGAAAAAYAQRSLRDWHSGSKRMNGSTLSRLAAVAPYSWSNTVRTDLALCLYSPLPTSGLAVAVGPGIRGEQDALAAMDAWLVELRPQWHPATYQLGWLSLQVRLSVEDQYRVSFAGERARAKTAISCRDWSGTQLFNFQPTRLYVSRRTLGRALWDRLAPAAGAILVLLVIGLVLFASALVDFLATAYLGAAVFALLHVGLGPWGRQGRNTNGLLVVAGLFAALAVGVLVRDAVRAITG